MQQKSVTQEQNLAWTLDDAYGKVIDLCYLRKNFYSQRGIVT